MDKSLQEWAGAEKTAGTTLALILTDIVGSTPLTAELGNEKWTELLIKHFAQARKLLAEYDCYEIKIIGDAFMVAFRTAADALRFALAFHAETGDEHIRIRAGIHVGPVRILGNDLYGGMVNYTARVVASVEEDGIALSDTAKKNVSEILGRRASLRFADYEVVLKGFPELQRLWRVWKSRVLAVLPFEVRSGDSREGLKMADALILKLNKSQEVIVRATGAVGKYDRLGVDPLEAGRELEADFVVAGSIEQAHGQTLVKARLLRVADGAELWAERFEDDANGRPGAAAVSQHEAVISLQVARKLKLKETERIARTYTQSAEAYQEYRWGRYFMGRFDEHSLNKALEHFQKAIVLDNDYAKARAGMAAVYAWIGILNFVEPQEAFKEAKFWAESALAMDPTLASAHASMGFTSMFSELDWERAEREFKEAISLNPNFATAHHGYSVWLTARGRFEEALAEVEQALEVDPTSFIINLSKGITLYVAGQYDRSLEQFNKVVTFNPDFDAGYYGLALAYEQNEMYEQAVKAAQEAFDKSERHPIKMAARAHVFAMSGKKEDARRDAETLSRLSRRHYVSPFHIALIYAAIGEVDLAFKYLEEAYEVRDQWLVFMCVEPRIKSLSGDKRFKELLRKIGLLDCLDRPE
jgi:class 3 adenylate cyclase/tetratricopeptide (TPR) repeat protein